MPEPQSETRELLCELNETELLQRGDQMADAELRIEQLKLKRSEIADRIKAERALRRKLAGVIDAGAERRDVLCKWMEDFVRQDTGDEIDTRAMTAADRQEPMGFDGEDDADLVGDDDGEPGPPRMREHLDEDPDDEPADEQRSGKHLNA